VLHEVGTHLAVGLQPFLDQLRVDTVTEPRRRHRSQPLDIELVGIEQEADERFGIVRVRSDIREDEHARPHRIVTVRRSRIGPGGRRRHVAREHH
jgi:hypothetical protein